MFHAGIASRSIGLFSIDDQARVALIALHFAAVRAVGDERRVPAVALYGTFAEKPMLALGVGRAMAELGAEIMPLNQMLDTLANWVAVNVCKDGGN